MSDTATKPPPNDLYEADFYAWTQEQARLLRERRWNDLDLENLVDEVESVGRSDKRQIERRLEVLIAHLLKWKFQPGRREVSWRTTISQQRDQLHEIVNASPSLRDYVVHQARERYVGGVLKASEESGIAIGFFPNECPFTSEQVLDPEFFPEDRTIE